MSRASGLVFLVAYVTVLFIVVFATLLQIRSENAKFIQEWKVYSAGQIADANMLREKLESLEKKIHELSRRKEPLEGSIENSQ